MGRGMTRTARKIKQRAMNKGGRYGGGDEIETGNMQRRVGINTLGDRGRRGSTRYNGLLPRLFGLLLVQARGGQRNRAAARTRVPSGGGQKRWGSHRSPPSLQASAAKPQGTAVGVLWLLLLLFCLVARKALSRAEAVVRRSLANNCGAKRGFSSSAGPRRAF